MNEYLESKKILAMLWGVSLTMSSGTALAACVPGDCIGLGYTKSEASCEGDIIRCPFDTSKVFCKEKEVYVMEAGDILYSDKTTTHYYTDSSKTPIGVVVDPNRRLAMALTCSLKQWASKGNNNTNITGIPDKKPEDTKTDFNGKSYTKIIVDNCGSACPAAFYAYNYTTAGTSRGDWFLPSGGQLWLLDQNKEKIKMGLAKVGGQLPYGNEVYTYIESSNEGENKYDSVKTSIYLSFHATYTSVLNEGNKYKPAYLDVDFSCPFIEF